MPSLPCQIRRLSGQNHNEYLMWQTVEGLAPNDTRPASAADPVGAAVGMGGGVQVVTSDGVRVDRSVGLTRPAGYVATVQVPKVFAIERGAPGSGDAFVATDVGVYRWDVTRGQWATFNEGLPAVQTTDLAYEPTTLGWTA